MDRVETDKVSDKVYVYTSQQQSNSLHPNGAIKLDINIFFERRQAGMKARRNEIGETRLFISCKE